MTSLILTVTETLRYRGKLGQWAWVLHRIAGLGTLLFVVLHVIDTSWATFYPDLYQKAIEAYKTPLYTIGEFILVACVVYHALNGFRVAILDTRPQWWKYQARATWLVLIGAAVLLVPAFLIMANHVVNYYNTRVSLFDLGLDKLVESLSPFAVGAVVVMFASLTASVVVGFVPSAGGGSKGRKVWKGSRLDHIMWVFMRTSGVAIIPLVFGHLLMIHLIQGVFDITNPAHIPVGTTLGRTVGEFINPILMGQEAANFVALRWNTVVAGVFIWRVYDILLLILIVIHGFWGARYVVNDYFHNKVINRAFRMAFLGLAIALILVGSLAILNTIPASTEAVISGAGVR